MLSTPSSAGSLRSPAARSPCPHPNPRSRKAHALLSSDRRSRGSVLNCTPLYSAVLTVFVALGLARRSEDSAQDRTPALRLAYSANRPSTAPTSRRARSPAAPPAATRSPEISRGHPRSAEIRWPAAPSAARRASPRAASGTCTPPTDGGACCGLARASSRPSPPLPRRRPHSPPRRARRPPARSTSRSRSIRRRSRRGAETPPRHFCDTSETPPRHASETRLRDTPQTPPRHFRDAFETLAAPHRGAPLSPTRWRIRTLLW